MSGISKSALLQLSPIFNDYTVTTDSPELSILGDFLTSDCRVFGIDTYRTWALDPTDDASNGNLTFLDKTEQGICLASDLNNAEPPYLYLSPDNLIEILDTWKKIVQSMPQEVNLIMENDRVRLEVVK